LGYVQWGSLRKQILSDWKTDFNPNKDYFLVHDYSAIREYEHNFLGRKIRSLTLTDSSRGLLFISYSGVQKVLERSKKATLVAFRVDYPILETWLKDSPESPKLVSLPIKAIPVASPIPEPVKSEPDTVVPADMAMSMKDRKFVYEVLQRLLNQLQELSDPTLREIAIVSAEAATGKTLSSIRLTSNLATIFPKPRPAQVTAPAQKQLPLKLVNGPLFTEDGFYSFTSIGEKAGGYSARSAGKAADVIALSMGYSHHSIRTVRLSFNELLTVKDSNGHERPVVRFAKNFANSVIEELRSGTYPPLPIAKVSSFSSGSGGRQNLSEPIVLDEEDDPSGEPSDHLGNIIATLQDL
jgi:hypothetical protein